MKNINLLDSDTINAIAAGEVVERPSSVVKELVENSVDAHATAITVEIRGGGIDMIRVTDNGSGIDRDDIDSAFLRHATSKIRQALDLLTVGTLGFRGEALSSIAAVGQVELITKTRHDITGVRYMIEGGAEHLKEDIGCPDGTTIIVRNLFFNTPARRKFLKTPMTEGAYVADLMDRMALARPDISFKFINNGQNKLHTSGNNNLKDIIYQIYGRDVTLHLLSARTTTELLGISGFIGKPILSRGNRNWENYFINGRFIKSNIVTKAIEDAYKTFVMIHKFPFTALHLTIEPELIDVNVHPRKMEIRFTQNEAVYNQVYDTVRRILENRELIPAGSFRTKTSENTGKNKNTFQSLAENAAEENAKYRNQNNADNIAANKDQNTDQAGLQNKNQNTDQAGLQNKNQNTDQAGVQRKDQREGSEKGHGPEPFEIRRLASMGINSDGRYHNAENTYGSKTKSLNSFSASAMPEHIEETAGGRFRSTPERTTEAAGGRFCSDGKSETGNFSETAGQVPDSLQASGKTSQGEDYVQSGKISQGEDYVQSGKTQGGAYVQQSFIAEDKAGFDLAFSKDSTEAAGDDVSGSAPAPVGDNVSGSAPAPVGDNVSGSASASGGEPSGLETQAGGDFSQSLIYSSRNVRQMDMKPHQLFDKNSKYSLIGQVFGTYWMLEFDGKLYMMDQHAAHEKVLYEKFKKAFEQDSVAMQHLAPPAIITLTAQEQQILKKYKAYFARLQFEIEPFGGDQFAIYGVPVYLFDMNVKDMFIEILDNLSDESGRIEGSAITWRIATMACKAAVKGNSRISAQEARALIEELKDCDNPYNCPHGRPTVISFTRYEIDKKFKRIQD